MSSHGARVRSASWVQDARGRWHARIVEESSAGPEQSPPTSAAAAATSPRAAALMRKTHARTPTADSASLQQPCVLLSKTWKQATARLATLQEKQADLDDASPMPTDAPVAVTEPPTPLTPLHVSTLAISSDEQEQTPLPLPPQCDLCPPTPATQSTHALTDCPYYCEASRPCDDPVPWRCTDFVPLERWIQALLQAPMPPANAASEYDSEDCAWEEPFNRELQSGAELARWRDVLLLTLPYHSSPYALLRKLLLLLREPPPPSPYEANPAVFESSQEEEGAPGTSLPSSSTPLLSLQAHAHGSHLPPEAALRRTDYIIVEEPLSPGSLLAAKVPPRSADMRIGGASSNNNNYSNNKYTHLVRPKFTSSRLGATSQDPLSCPSPSLPPVFEPMSPLVESSCGSSSVASSIVASSTSSLAQSPLAQPPRASASSLTALQHSGPGSILSTPSSSLSMSLSSGVGFGSSGPGHRHASLSPSPASSRASTVILSSHSGSIASVGSAAPCGTALSSVSSEGSLPSTASHLSDKSDLPPVMSGGGAVTLSLHRASSASVLVHPSTRALAFQRWHARKLHLLQLLHMWVCAYPQDFCCVPFVPSPPKASRAPPAARPSMWAAPPEPVPPPSSSSSPPPRPRRRPLDELLLRELASFPPKEWVKTKDWDQTISSAPAASTGAMRIAAASTSPPSEQGDVGASSAPSPLSHSPTAVAGGAVGVRSNLRRCQGRAVAMDASMQSHLRAVAHAIGEEYAVRKGEYEAEFPRGVGLAMEGGEGEEAASVSSPDQTMRTMNPSSPSSSSDSPSSSTSSRGWSLHTPPGAHPSLWSSSNGFSPSSSNSTTGSTPSLLHSRSVMVAASNGGGGTGFSPSIRPAAHSVLNMSSSSQSQQQQHAVSSQLPSAWTQSWGSPTVQTNLANSDKLKRLMGGTGQSGGGGGTASPLLVSRGSLIATHNNNAPSPRNHRGSSSTGTMGVPLSPSMGPLLLLSSSVLQQSQARFAAEFLRVSPRAYASALTWLAIARLGQIGQCGREQSPVPPGGGARGGALGGDAAATSSSSMRVRPSFHHPSPLTSPSFPRLFLRMAPSLARAQMNMSNTFSCFVATSILNAPNVHTRRQVLARWVEVAAACLCQPAAAATTHSSTSTSTSTSTTRESSHSSGSAAPGDEFSGGVLPLCNPNFMHAFEIIYGINHQSVYRLPSVQVVGPEGKLGSGSSGSGSVSSRSGSIIADALTSLRKGSAAAATSLATSIPLLDKRSFLSSLCFDQYQALTKLTSPKMNYKEYRRALEHMQARLPPPPPAASASATSSSSSSSAWSGSAHSASASASSSSSASFSSSACFHIPYLGILLKDLVGLEDAGRPMAGVAADPSAPGSDLSGEEEDEDEEENAAEDVSEVKKADATSTSVQTSEAASPSHTASSVDVAASDVTDSATAAADLSSPPPTGSLPWEDTFLPRNRRNATMTPLDIMGSRGAQATLLEEDEEEDVFGAAPSEEQQQQPLESSQAVVPPPLPVLDEKRSATLLEMLTEEGDCGSDSVGGGVGRLSLGFRKETPPLSPLGRSVFASAANKQRVSLLSAALPGRQGSRNAPAAAATAGAIPSLVRSSDHSAGPSSAVSLVTSGTETTTLAASSPAPDLLLPPPSACLLLNYSKLAKVHAIALATLRCRLFFPLPPVTTEVEEEVGSVVPVVTAPSPSSSPPALPARKLTAPGADATSRTVDDSSLSPFTRALVAAALTPSTAQALRACADASSGQSICDGHADPGASSHAYIGEKARPATVTIVVTDGSGTAPTPGTTPRAGTSSLTREGSGKDAAAAAASRSDSALQYDVRLQHWLVSSMLTSTIMEEAQLMQRSYEIFPRKGHTLR